MSRGRSDRTRRDVLSAGSAVLTAGVAAGVAGCLGSSGGGGDDADGNGTTTTGTTGGDGGPPFGGNLLAYYSFDGESGDTVSDRSGNGNDADVFGAARGEGKSGTALTFDGKDDYVETPVKYAEFGEGLTLEAWARNDDLSAGWGWVFTQRKYEDQWSQLGVHSDGGGKLRWELLVGEGVQATIDAPEGTVEEGTWHHWVGTWAKGEGLRLYVDAELVATSAEATYCARGCEAGNSKPLHSAGPINMGGQGREAEYWKGAIDEAKLYDRALTAEEVATAYGVHGP